MQHTIKQKTCLTIWLYILQLTYLLIKCIHTPPFSSILIKHCSAGQINEVENNKNRQHDNSKKNTHGFRKENNNRQQWLWNCQRMSHVLMHKPKRVHFFEEKAWGFYIAISYSHMYTFLGVYTYRIYDPSIYCVTM